MGSRNLKIIKGRPYLYYVISKDGKKKAVYCGLASKHESEKKALALELEETTMRIKSLEQKAVGIRTKLEAFPEARQ